MATSKTYPFVVREAAPTKRLRSRQNGKEFLCRWECWHVHKPDWMSVRTATSASKAKNRYFLDFKAAWPDVKYTDIRVKLVGVLYEIGVRVPPEERKTLEILRHALGLKDYCGDGQAYRNCYATYRTSDDYAYCMELCTRDVPLLGYRAVDSLAKDMVYFHVTIAGKDYVDKRYGISTEPEHNEKAA